MTIRAPSVPPEHYRPHMGLEVKLRAALIALGLDPDTTEFHHDPPLALRPWDDDAQDYRPAANDPRHIVPMGKLLHRERTAKQDIPAAAKTKRQVEDQEEFRRRLLAKERGEERESKSRLRGRGFPKRPKPAVIVQAETEGEWE